MWSKQADVRNANMTSFKNKITNRKQKNSKSSANNTTPTKEDDAQQSSTTNNVNNNKSSIVDTPSLDNSSTSCQSGRKQKSGKNRHRNGSGNKKNLAADKNQDLQHQHNDSAELVDSLASNRIRLKDDEDDIIPVNNDTEDVVDHAADVDNDPEMADVELRHPSSVVEENLKNDTINNVVGLKRYSDSFVIQNGKEKYLVPEPEELTGNDKATRKGRRLSDFFRGHSGGNIKPTVSMESLNMPKQTDDKSDKAGSKSGTSTSSTNDKSQSDAKSNKKGKKGTDNKSATLTKETSSKQSLSKESKNAKNLEKVSTPFVKPTCDTNSYLKRVKSKIYKTKSDEGAALAAKINSGKKSNTCDRIPEETLVKNQAGGKSDPRRSLYFGLIRQTSNLEQVRPSKTASTTKLANKDSSNDDTSLCDSGFEQSMVPQKPLLTKAKSSSAINLNLLRTRRNRIMEQLKEKRCKDVFDEFDFIAYGGFRDKFGGSQRISSVIHENQSTGGPEERTDEDNTQLGESKPSQPVSRSGSDRRPDVVREEISKTSLDSCGATTTTVVEHDKQETVDACISDNAAASFPSSSTSANSKKRTSSNINRSESVKEQTEKRKQRRNFSDPSHNNTTTTSGDVDLDHHQQHQQHPGLSNTESGSSSNSSISYNGRLSESPSTSADAVTSADGLTSTGAVKRTSSDLESDTEVEEPTNWQRLFPEEELRNLQPHEKKRQDVINEMFHTEHTHVRNLKVLYKIFYKALSKNQVVKPEELSLIFPNIKDVLNVHTHFNNEMRRKRREDPLVGNLGDMLADMFGGSSGESLQKAAAAFCERQQLALEFIKERRKRDSKFEAVLMECEKSPSCRRLPLQGILPTEMQRLSKYPLLLERLISSLEPDSGDPQAQEELVKLRRAHQSSKEILNYVNEAAKLAWNRARLEDIQRHLDASNFERSDHAIAQEFRTMDLTRYKLIVEGNMQLRRPNKGIVPVHVLLLEEAVVILHKESERYILKFFQSGSSAQPQPLSPIIKMSTLLVRNNAVCKNALFLVNTSTNNSQMYDLLAEDDLKRDVWFKHFSDASDAHNRREGKSNKRPEPPPAPPDTSGVQTGGGVGADESETVQEIPSTKDLLVERAETVGGGPSVISEDGSSNQSLRQSSDNNNAADGDIVIQDNNNESNVGDSSNVEDEEEPPFSDAREDGILLDPKGVVLGSSSEGGYGGGDGVVHTRKVTAADDWPLIPPSHVHVIEQPPIHTAESRLTPLEQIRRKDEEVRRALEDKQGLVADLLSIPREDFHVIADIAGDEQAGERVSKDLAERVMAAIYQVDQLHLAVNESLNVTEASAVAATGGKHPVCQSEQTTTAAVQSAVAAAPSIPVNRVQDIANMLSSQLTTLLSEVKSMDEDRARLRKELHRMRENFHEQQSLHNTSIPNDNNSSSSINISSSNNNIDHNHNDDDNDGEVDDVTTTDDREGGSPPSLSPLPLAPSVATSTEETQPQSRIAEQQQQQQLDLDIAKEDPTESES